MPDPVVRLRKGRRVVDVPDVDRPLTDAELRRVLMQAGYTDEQFLALYAKAKAGGLV